MTYQEIHEICKKGKVGIIPGWKGYLKWDYAKNELYFFNENYRMNQVELEKHIINRDDLFYIT